MAEYEWKATRSNFCDFFHHQPCV